VTRDLLPPEKWEELKVLFDDAARLPPDQREAAVAAATDDPELRREVLALLLTLDQAGSFLSTPDPGELVPGRRLGPYEIVDHLGGGGMGEVYRGHDTRLNRHVAIKVLRGRLGDDGGRARFLREARAIAALSHSNVLAIHDVGESSGFFFLVTELLAGETLRARLRRERPGVEEALDWTAQVAGGLAAAHAAGIIHRDLKPENVFLLADGTVKILDFGLARAPAVGSIDDSLSLPGMVLGTAGYLAPEQARGLVVTPAADLFSLGAILFELLTGQRAFRGESAADTLRAVLDHDPPPPSSLRPEVPGWIDRVVARCLAKDVAARFESARDLAFALQAPRAAGGVGPAPRRRRRRALAALLGAVAGVALCAALAAVLWPRPPATPWREPVRPYPLTFSGRDRHPTVSPDGRFLAFTSDRDGRSRIWVQQIDVGRETPLTAGPDSAPRFSPDGNHVLFTRGQAGGAALYRVSLVGGEVRRVADDASDGDWSPDGSQVAFVRSRNDGTRAHPVLMIAPVDGSGERELARLGDRPQRGRGVEQRVRWSPDGTRIAVSGFVQHPGTPQHVMLVPLDGSRATIVPAPGRVGLVSAVAWEAADTLLYSQSLSVSGNSAGSMARVVRQRVHDGAWTTLLWTPESSFVVERWPGRGIVYDARSSRQNLREVALGGGASRTLSQGTSTDRQPWLSPDGKKVVFTSNRGGGSLDVWVVDRASGLSERLTDHPGEDYDPALTPDGRHLLWSSNRSGIFEVWMADADGTSPRQVTRDGVDAENPTATADGQWVLYACGAPGRAGVWRIRPDGSDARRLVPDAVLPEVSPDGRHVLFLVNRHPGLAIIGVARVEDGVVLPFEIRVEVRKQTQALLGRARWMSDGRAIAFVGQDDTGATGIFTQAFAPVGDTSETRTPLAGFDPDRLTESFDIDADRVILAESDQRSDVMAAVGLPR
jgi:Tol biopolymer transport system component